MKILHVITTINRGGAENHLVELVQGQIEKGHAVSVAYLKGDGYWEKRFRALGCSVHSLQVRGNGDLTGVLRLRRIVRTLRPNLVHAHMPPAELFCRLALLGPVTRGLPLVVSKHNDEPFFRAPGWAWVGRWCARRAGKVICISEAVKDYFVAHGLARKANDWVPIHYGIDASPYRDSGAAARALRAEWGLKEGDFVVGTVARLVPQKALHILLEGFAAFRARQEGGRLVIVGRGPLEKELRKKAEDLGLGDSILWAGYREDIPTVLQVFNVFALTSSYEGLGLVLLEAMAAARPVVATRVSAIPEVVAEGETGILVPSGDPAALARALEKMIDSDLRRRMGAKGRNRVTDRFTLEKMVERTLEVYAECAA